MGMYLQLLASTRAAQNSYYQTAPGVVSLEKVSWGVTDFDHGLGFGDSKSIHQAGDHKGIWAAALNLITTDSGVDQPR